MGIVDKFLKNFPTTRARNLSDFPAELLQLIFFYLPLGDLKSLVLVCKRWNDVGERSKLWEKEQLLVKEKITTWFPLTIFPPLPPLRCRPSSTVRSRTKVL